jgi:hypothetical protein
MTYRGMALILWSLYLPLFGTSCSLPQKHASGLVSHGELFPYGTYMHKVTLVIPAKSGNAEKKLELNGVVQLRAGAVHVVGLSFFGTTAFKIDENRDTGEIKIEVYVDQMKKYEPRLREYYLLLREVLLAKSGPSQNQGRLKVIQTNEIGLPIEMETVGFDSNASFRLSRFDKNGVPAEFAIESARFSVKVEVTGYEI